MMNRYHNGKCSLVPFFGSLVKLPFFYGLISVTLAVAVLEALERRGCITPVLQLLEKEGEG